MSATACGFPACRNDATTAAGMCHEHRKVTVSASYLDDKHKDGGHG